MLIVSSIAFLLQFREAWYKSVDAENGLEDVYLLSSPHIFLAVFHKSLGLHPQYSTHVSQSTLICQ